VEKALKMPYTMTSLREEILEAKALLLQIATSLKDVVSQLEDVNGNLESIQKTDFGCPPE
jgi:hypothetical protein